MDKVDQGEEKACCRREARRLERRAAIMAVAQKHFSEQGYGGTSMSAIAAELGGSKSTLWTYFSSKEELFAAALDGWIQQFGFVREMEVNGDLRQTLRRYCIDFLKVMLSLPARTLFRLIIAETPRFPEVGRIFYEHGPLWRHKALAAYLEEQVLAGNLREMDSLHASAQLHHLCMQRLFMHVMWGLDPDISEENIAREIDAALDLFLHGFAARPTPEQ
ncbi:MAG: TetR/AcrR family transcriptional regulator [Sphingobium sp.]